MKRRLQETTRRPSARPTSEAGRRRGAGRSHAVPGTRANLSLDAFADASRELADTGPMMEATDRPHPDSAARPLPLSCPQQVRFVNRTVPILVLQNPGAGTFPDPRGPDPRRSAGENGPENPGQFNAAGISPFVTQGFGAAPPGGLRPCVPERRHPPGRPPRPEVPHRRGAPPLPRNESERCDSGDAGECEPRPRTAQPPARRRWIRSQHGSGVVMGWRRTRGLWSTDENGRPVWLAPDDGSGPLAAPAEPDDVDPDGR